MSGSRIARVGLIGLLVALAAPGAAFAQGAGINLALQAFDQPGTFFDLTMRPGETRDLLVAIANNGSAALAARTYAADVNTIINGGFGASLRDQPTTGTTRWLDYPGTVLELSAGESLHRPLAVSVPRDAGPGEYISSILLENDQPIEGGGAIGLNQVIRQAIAVVVTVPGERSPALTIGDAGHEVVAGTSIVAVALANPGNVRLKPSADFTLMDARGVEVSHATVPMDTFYARTQSSIEVPLAALLNPGSYTIRLTVDDAAQGVHASEGAIPLLVEAPSVTATDSPDGARAARTAITQGAANGEMSIPVWLMVVCAIATVGAAGLVLILIVRRRPASSRR